MAHSYDRRLDLPRPISVYAFLLIAILACLSSPSCWAASYQAAGAIDGDVILVDRDSIATNYDNGTKLIIGFTWVLANSIAGKSVDGKQYDSIVEEVFTHCTDTSSRGVHLRVFEFRGLKDRIRQERVVVKEEPFRNNPDAKISIIRSASALSPAKLATSYACAVAESKARGTPLAYQVPTNPADSDTRLLCILSSPSGNDLELPVSFNEKRGVVTVGAYAHEVFEISENQISIEMRKVYGQATNDKLVISRVSGKAVGDGVLNGICTPASAKKF